MKKLIVSTAIALTLIVLPGCAVTTTGGEHVGIVTAMEKHGLIWKTWDAYVKTDATSSQEDTYCVEDSDVVDMLRQFNVSREKVVLHYHAEMITAPWRCNGNEIIDAAESAK